MKYLRKELLNKMESPDVARDKHLACECGRRLDPVLEADPYDVLHKCFDDSFLCDLPHHIYESLAHFIAVSPAFLVLCETTEEYNEAVSEIRGSMYDIWESFHDELADENSELMTEYLSGRWRES